MIKGVKSASLLEAIFKTTYSEDVVLDLIHNTAQLAANNNAIRQKEIVNAYKAEIKDLHAQLSMIKNSIATRTSRKPAATMEQAQKIRKEHDAGISNKDLAKKYNLSTGTISRIIHNKRCHDPKYTYRK